MATNPTPPTFPERIDEIVMAVINHGHQVITEQDKKDKSYVYYSGLNKKKLVLTRFEAKAALLQAVEELVLSIIGEDEPLLEQSDFDKIDVPHVESDNGLIYPIIAMTMTKKVTVRVMWMRQNHDHSR